VLDCPAPLLFRPAIEVAAPADNLLLPAIRVRFGPQGHGDVGFAAGAAPVNVEFVRGGIQLATFTSKKNTNSIEANDIKENYRFTDSIGVHRMGGDGERQWH